MVTGGVAVDGPGEDDHQWGAQRRGEVDAGRGVRAVAQLVQHSIPHGHAGGARQVVDQVGRGEVDQLDAGGRGQHVGGRDNLSVLRCAAGQQQRQRRRPERVQRVAPQSLGDLVEPVQNRQDAAGLDQRGGLAGSAGRVRDQARVVTEQLGGQPVP